MFNFASPSLSSMGNNGNNRMYSSMNNASMMNGSSQQQPTVHTSYRCDGCGIEPIVGVRYHCATCGNFDYCEPCYRAKKSTLHPSFHSFVTNGRGVSNVPSSQPQNLSSSVLVNNSNNTSPHNNMLTNNPMINSTSNVSSSSSSNMVYQSNPQRPLNPQPFPVNNIYQPPPSYPRGGNPPPISYPQTSYPQTVSNVGTSTISTSTPISIVNNSSLMSNVRIPPPSTNHVLSSASSSPECKTEKECHCCNAPLLTNIHQCTTCFDLTPSEDYTLCKDCHENFKQFGSENPIHLHGHTFQHFVDVKHLNIWKKTKGLENMKKQSSDKFGELEKLEIEEDHLLCVICNEKLRNIVFLDCKHCVCCHECVDQLKKVEVKRECPLCRTASEHIKIFWA